MASTSSTQTPTKIFYGDYLVTDMYDIYGNETDQVDEAFSFVALSPDGQWLSCECEYKDLIKKKLQ